MGRSTPCCEKKHTTSGAWSKEEDMRLIRYIKSNGEGCWSHVPRAAGLMRCGKSCRLRWMNYLRPGLKRGNFTEEEEKLIIRLQALLGNRWAIIAARLPGRTDNEVKNYWNTYIKRKLYSKGIDPHIHQPINGIATSSTATTAPPTNTEAAVLSVVTTNNKKTDKDNSTSFSTTTITTTAPPTTNNNNTNNSSKIQLFGTESAGGEDSNSSSNSSSGVTTEEAYPELNLELSLGLPSQQEHREQKGLCFYCRLGFPANYQACSCKAKAKVTASATTVAAAPDALMPQQECA